MLLEGKPKMKFVLSRGFFFPFRLPFQPPVTPRGTARVLICAAGLTALVCAASQPWKKGDAEHWSEEEVQRVTTDSPWAQPVAASFALAEQEREPPPPGPLPGAKEAGLAGPRGATDGRWDGGVGRADRRGEPFLNVTVRWDSALPIRQALQRSHSGPSFAPEQLSKNYILTVVGLVPAGHYAKPDLTSHSDSAEATPRNPEEMLGAVMRYSRLYPKGKTALRPVDATIDGATGDLHLFFSRSEAITLDQKEVTFETRFGSLTILKKFRLKDMVYQNVLEL